MKELDCLFIGSTTKDILMLLDSPPASDQRITASYFATTCGGVSSTAASAYQALGGNVGVISAVGDDDTSIFIRENLEGEYFTYLKLYTIPGHFSSTSLVQVERNGKRCLTCFGGCIDELEYSMIDLDVLHHTKVLHLGVLRPELMLQLSKYCKEHTDARLSIDGGNIPQELVDKLLPYTDIFIPDRKTAMKNLNLGPKEACAYYVTHGAKFAAVTNADEGTYAYDGKSYYYAATPSVPVLDTTGAGDNFHGAFLYCINKGWDITQCLQFSNVFASLTCRGLGGHSAIPTLEEVKSYL